MNTRIIIPPLHIFAAPYQEYLSPYETALRLGIAQKTIWDWARNKTIQSRKTEGEWQYEIESSPLGILDTYLLEFKDINTLFSIPEITVKQWLKRKGLRGIKTGKLWRFAPADLFNFFSENTNLLDNFFNHPDRKRFLADDDEDEIEESWVYERGVNESDWEKIISERKHWMKYGNIEKPRKNSKSSENEFGKVTPFSPIYIGGGEGKKYPLHLDVFRNRIKTAKFKSKLTAISDEINKALRIKDQISSEDLEKMADSLLYADDGEPTDHENHEEYPILTDSKIKELRKHEVSYYDARWELEDIQEITDEYFRPVTMKAEKAIYLKDEGFVYLTDTDISSDEDSRDLTEEDDTQEETEEDKDTADCVIEKAA